MTPALPDTECRRRVYLMRHGEVAYFDAEGKPVDPRTVTLTEDGRAQARAVAELLREVPLDTAICSGMARTRETAEIVTEGRDLAVADAPGLREIRIGRFREVPRDEIERQLAYPWELVGDGTASIAGGEPFADFEVRVTAAWRDILDGPPWTTMLLVAHDAVNRLLLGWAAGTGLAGLAAFEQDMGCLNVIDVDIRNGAVERALIRAVNVTPYNLSKHAINLTSMERVYREYRRD